MAYVGIVVNNKDLIENADKSFLAADIASGVSSLTLESTQRFYTNQIIVIGEIGTERTEIIKTHSATTPSGQTLTLASATSRAHQRGDPVYIINYDRYELSHATTATGSKTTLTITGVDSALGSGLITIDSEKEFTTYFDAQFSTGYYFVRKKETIGNTFSGYSDPIPASGLEINSVGYAIDYALRRNSTAFGEKITHEFMIEEVNSCLKYIRGKQLRWPEDQSLNTVLGQTSRGTNVFALSGLSTAIYDANSNKSIIGLRIGGGSGLRYRDPVEWENNILGDVVTTQVTTQATSGQTTLEIDNSYDFDDSGTVHVFISGTQYDITYTGVTRSATAGILTGIPASGDGAITVTIPVDTNVWQDEDEGTPSDYTVRNGNVEIYPLPDGNNDNKNIYIDYFTIATVVDTDADTIDLQRFDIVKLWLVAKVRAEIKTEGKMPLDDPDFVLCREQISDAIKFKKGFRHPMRPKLNQISY